METTIILKGVFRDYIGIMEKKMETTKGIGVIGNILGVEVLLLQQQDFE